MSTETPDETIARLTESNRRLANQIVGYGDRMQQTIAGIVKTAKVEALREAADVLEGGAYRTFTVVEENRMEERTHIINVLRTRADSLEAS